MSRIILTIVILALSVLGAGSQAAAPQAVYAQPLFELDGGVIIIDKVTDPSGDPQSFTFDASWID
jgi:hypothetical protein